MAQKYTQAFLREIKDKNGRRTGWKGVLKYKEPNPDFIPKPDGVDTRKPGEKRREIWRQIAKTFDKSVRTKTQATAALQEWRMEEESIASQGDGASKIVTAYVADYIDLREHVSIDGKRVLEQSTVLDYRKTAKHLEPDFSAIAVGDVTSKFVKDWERKQLENGMSIHAVRKAHRLLHVVFQHAFLEEDIPSNPLARVIPPEAIKKEADSLSRADMQSITQRLESMEPTPVVVAAYIGLHAGLRCGEVCALRWRDIDFESETITVRKSIGYRAGGAYEKNRTKTGKSRTIDFDSPHMGEILKKRRSLMLRQRDNIATDFQDLFVIGEVDGTFAKPTTISRNWTALTKEWGLASESGGKANFHLLRHSNVTAQLASGASLKDVAANAGHASTSMTADVYAAALRRGKREAAQRGGEWMRPAETQADIECLKTGTA